MSKDDYIPEPHEVNAMTEGEFKVYENRLRRMAGRQQLQLQKSWRKDQYAFDYKTYQLVNELGDVWLGDSVRGYGLSITEVHRSLVGGCTHPYSSCTGKNVERAQDPYEADVNNSPGVMIMACEECLQQLGNEV
jgi:hypothetical protein